MPQLMATRARAPGGGCRGQEPCRGIDDAVDPARLDHFSERERAGELRGVQRRDGAAREPAAELPDAEAVIGIVDGPGRVAGRRLMGPAEARDGSQQPSRRPVHRSWAKHWLFEVASAAAATPRSRPGGSMRDGVSGRAAAKRQERRRGGSLQPAAAVITLTNEAAG
jgi:hypothetical protein